MVYTPVRVTPDAEKMLIAVLTAGTVRCSTDPPANLYTVLPYTVAYRFGGLSVDPRFVDRATCHLQCYGSSRDIASDLAETCRVLLFRAWRSGIAYGGARVSKFNEVLAPFGVPDPSMPDRVWRFDATYSLRVRPA